jgi:N4-gp56 family major capsid protein
MADTPITSTTLSNDQLSYWIAEKMIELANKNIVLGQAAQDFQLPSRTSKTLRVDRYSRFNLPTATLSEGVAPDAVAFSVEKVDVTVEQWGIVALLTDVGVLTAKHPALAIAQERVALAMKEVIERETAEVLMAGTNIFYSTDATSRALTDDETATGNVMNSAVVRKTVASLRQNGAMDFGGGLMLGVMPPGAEHDMQADSAFSQAAAFSQVQRQNEFETGVWAGVRWLRSNFLPYFKGVPAPTTGAATSEKAQVTAVDGGGTLTSGANFQFKVVAREIATDYERKISVQSGSITAAATGNNESFDVILPSGGNAGLYVYDIYMTQAGGTTAYLVASRQAAGATVTITTAPAGTEAVAPASPTDQKVVWTSFVFGKGAFGKVVLDGMSLQAYLTPNSPSYSNPLVQGRKVGAKVMWKPFILDNNYFARIETTSSALNSTNFLLA